MEIHIRDGQKGFRPGETLAGEISWLLDLRPESVELRLFWFTRGRGTEDVELVQTIPFDNPGQEDQRSFQVRLPESPYSFSGKLITLVWALEAAAKPGTSSARAEFFLSPSGEEIRLQR